MVNEKEIQAALIKGARSTSDIQKMTRAGTSCGRCLAWIDSIVAEFLDNLPDDLQQRLNFDE
jgi:nitrite reductase (NADH) large subunit